MSDNLNATLAGLAAEVNALEADRVAGNQGKMAEMGHKLIAIRQILREINGVHTKSQKALDGWPPKGWGTWCKENLRITYATATGYVRFVLHPDGPEKRKKSHGNYFKTPKGGLYHARKAWPTWAPEQRDEFSAGVLQLLKTP